MAATISVMSGGCKEEPLQLFEAKDMICFWDHSTNYSFYGATNEEQADGVIRMKIRIMGYTKPYDREVTGAAIADTPGTPEEDRLTTATPGEYTILGGTIPAGEVEGFFEVEVKNQEKLADGELRLNLALTENEDFGPGTRENRTMSLVWSRQFLQPQTWSSMRTFICATWSSQVYRIFMEVTGLKELWYTSDGPDPENNPEDARVTAETARVYGRMFGDYVRAWELEHGEKLLHDDGSSKGLPIIPVY